MQTPNLGSGFFGMLIDVNITLTFKLTYYENSQATPA